VGVMKHVDARVHPRPDGAIVRERFDRPSVVGAKAALGVADARVSARGTDTEISKCVDDLDTEPAD
jgi:hypothetical protein